MWRGYARLIWLNFTPTCRCLEINVWANILFGGCVNAPFVRNGYSCVCNFFGQKLKSCSLKKRSNMTDNYLRHYLTNNYHESLKHPYFFTHIQPPKIPYFQVKPKSKKRPGPACRSFSLPSWGRRRNSLNRSEEAMTDSILREPKTVNDG